jgi:hypothetical protein
LPAEARNDAAGSGSCRCLFTGSTQSVNNASSFADVSLRRNDFRLTIPRAVIRRIARLAWQHR